MKFASLFCLIPLFAFASGNTGSIVQIGDMLAGEESHDLLGYDVAISGDGKYVAAGSYSYDGPDDSLINAGKVDVYEKKDGAWIPKGNPIVGVQKHDKLGKSLDFNQDGSMLAIGGHKMKARVYSFSKGNWEPKGSELDTSGSANPQIFSIALSDDGSTVAVGEVVGKGRVDVFTWNEAIKDWEKKDVLEGTKNNKRFGHSVALNGDGSVLAIGTPELNKATVYNCEYGSYYVPVYTVKASTSGDKTGWSVALNCDGTIFAVGSPIGGFARVFSLESGTWAERGTKLTYSGSELPGRSVSLSSDGAILGVTGQKFIAAYHWNDESSSYDTIAVNIEPTEFGNQGDMAKDGRTIIGGWKKESMEDLVRMGAAKVYSISGEDLPKYAAKGSCFEEAAANGDPHFSTWTKEHFEYHGQCDLVMVKDPSFADDLGLDVHIRTKIVRFWSYIQSVAIRIGNDVLEIHGSADPNDTEAYYWKNFEYQGSLEELGGFPVTQSLPVTFKRTFKIDLSSKYAGQYILVQMYKEFIKVEFHGGASAFGRTVGLLGDFKTGKTLARDGTTQLDDFVEFGNEWQVLPSDGRLFHEMEEPQFPQKCIQPEDPNGERRRRLSESNIAIEEAEAACSTLKDELTIKECVYDILATQDLGMVGAF